VRPKMVVKGQLRGIWPKQKKGRWGQKIIKRPEEKYQGGVSHPLLIGITYSKATKTLIVIPRTIPAGGLKSTESPEGGGERK